jgi:hypothetical protein
MYLSKKENVLLNLENGIFLYDRLFDCEQCKPYQMPQVSYLSIRSLSFCLKVPGVGYLAIKYTATTRNKLFGEEGFSNVFYQKLEMHVSHYNY